MQWSVDVWCGICWGMAFGKRGGGGVIEWKTRTDNEICVYNFLLLFGIYRYGRVGKSLNSLILFRPVYHLTQRLFSTKKGRCEHIHQTTAFFETQLDFIEQVHFERNQPCTLWTSSDVCNNIGKNLQSTHHSHPFPPLARGNQLSEYFSFSDVVNYNPKHVALRICLSLFGMDGRTAATSRTTHDTIP